MSRPSILQALIAVFILIVVAAAFPLLLPGDKTRTISAYFATAIGVYPGSDVRVLGVKVGSISAIHPEGTQVRVVMHVSDSVPLPADARAVVVAPSLVSDRYVQFTPAYSGGARLPAGAVLDTSRTATPMELDQLYDSVRRFADSLGPNGLNKNGALGDFVHVGAANLDGNGLLLNQTIAGLGKASQTLSNSSDDLYETVGNLNDFSTMLRNNDAQIRDAEGRLADVSSFLAADRSDLAGSLRELSIALGQVKTFVTDNRTKLSTQVTKLASITQALTDQRAALAEALDNAPTLTKNALGAYDPATRSLMSRGDLLEITAAYGNPNQPGLNLSGLTADTRPVCAAATSAVSLDCGRISANGLTATPKGADVPPLPFPPAGPVYAGGGK